MQSERHIVLVGMDRTGGEVLRHLPAQWRIVAVDIDPVRLQALREARPDLECVVGDASSRLVLEQVRAGPATTLVVATPSDRVNAEVARIGRESFGIEDILILNNRGVTGGDFAQSVDRSHAAAAEIVERVGGLVVGSSHGEIVRVTILAGSAAIGRRLREFRRGQWLIAMIYRGGHIVVPHGDTVLAEGDRILLTGDPSELVAVAKYLRGGDPTFPAAWGNGIGVADAEGNAAAHWLAERTTAQTVVDLAGLFDDSATAETIAQRVRAADVGCLVVRPRPVAWTARMGLTRSEWPERLLAAQVPVLASRGNAAPERIVVAMAPVAEATQITGPAIDLARQAKVPLVFLTVLPPSVSPEADVVADVTSHALRYARLHGIEPQRIVESGNPIARIRSATQPNDLLVLGHAPAARNTWFTPDISLFLLHDTPCPALFVPRHGGT